MQITDVSPLISPPLIVAHRGASGNAPENTIAAFDLAAYDGADGIEFDVRLTGDGVPVVIHDARLERTTSGVGRVRDHSLAELKRLDAGSWFNLRHPRRARAQFRGQQIPTLEETLAWMRRRRMVGFLEVKRGAMPGIEERVLAEVQRAGVQDLTTVISFNLRILEKIRALDERIALGLDCTRARLALRRAQKIRAHALLPHWAFATRRWIHRAHQAKIKVLVWDLDQPAWMRKKVADGVDGVVTKYPDRMKGVLNLMGADPGAKPFG